MPARPAEFRVHEQIDAAAESAQGRRRVRAPPAPAGWRSCRSGSRRRPAARRGRARCPGRAARHARRRSGFCAGSPFARGKSRVSGPGQQARSAPAQGPGPRRRSARPARPRPAARGPALAGSRPLSRKSASRPAFEAGSAPSRRGCRSGEDHARPARAAAPTAAASAGVSAPRPAQRISSIGAGSQAAGGAGRPAAPVPSACRRAGRGASTQSSATAEETAMPRDRQREADAAAPGPRSNRGARLPVRGEAGPLGLVEGLEDSVR